MANEYLIKKWRLWFKCMDRRHAGEITKEDETRHEEAYLKAVHLEGEKKKELLETSKKLWNQYVFHDKEGPVSEEQFIEMTNGDFKADKAKFEEQMRKGLIEDMKAIDQSGEGTLNEKDFVTAYKAVGFTDEAWLKMFFQAFSPSNGKIPLEYLVDVWARFLVSEDDSKKDFILEALESCPEL